ncbi:sugar phosphate isomerase/epimerase family protein [Asticcacaulis solisilvae]|uniref:sugar phosphate isomerase/epimerase family protein n=1 Tax=Asticcacaulis solisilvae TaxID=1217274 RepID=UPI003FD82417
MTPLSRRSFTLALGSALMAGSAVARHHKSHSHPVRPARPPAHARWPMGIQLWTVNAEMKANPMATLKALKGLGFATVETAGLYGMSAATLRTHIEDAGLVCKSYHASMADLIASPEAHMANARTLGATWIVCASPLTVGTLDPSKPWLEAMYETMTLDGWKQNAAHLAGLVPLARQSGLVMTYHNHPMEFRDWNGVTGYSLLAKSSDALRFELDIGWVVAGGHDPLPILRQYAGRIDLLHVKDMVRDASAPLGWRSVEVGRGVIDWGPVLATARETGVKGYFIEQELPYLRPVMESLRISSDEIRRSKSFR